MLVVADTSPINYLVLIQHDAILPVLYERVVIPPAVLVDLQRPRTPEAVRTWVARPPTWFEVQEPRQPLNAQRYRKLGAGEREAIALAQQLHAHLLLIDDADGREEAELRVLVAIGTLGILENAAIQGLIDLPGALARLQATTFHARAELFQALLARDAARRRQSESA
jgi:predicted nucleic acid-binding protein